MKQEVMFLWATLHTFCLFVRLLNIGEISVIKWVEKVICLGIRNNRSDFWLSQIIIQKGFFKHAYNTMALTFAR